MHRSLSLILLFCFASAAIIRSKRSTEESKSSEEDIPTLFPISRVKLINGEYVTFRDKDPEEQAKNNNRDCIPRDQAELEDSANILKKAGELEASHEVNATFTFNDTSPIEGEIVEDTMEIKIYKPLCDD